MTTCSPKVVPFCYVGGLEDRTRARWDLGSGLRQALRKLWDNSSIILLGKTIPHTDKHAWLKGSKIWECKKPYSLIHVSRNHQQTFGYNDVLRTSGISPCSENYFAANYERLYSFHLLLFHKLQTTSPSVTDGEGAFHSMHLYTYTHAYMCKEKQIK